ncbi:ribosome small subunit-dependent GTPase A [Chitinivibrio alkaliphilus]|uniref:Small ribosomal subunit biogenesis GTPase RsgA n=1 Tax=Chitinivibrio alkaliphilus ACht1 TaxID=1313304 RepID=U7D7T8_9BACT|nr:ribosome small subunit-dependent GTPase A [Chitinivibrio alkaliphilus]ERP31157.1 ribosome small subunit-dependent GTPase A [Chitinivibrio alkaliphilus ACht1]
MEQTGRIIEERKNYYLVHTKDGKTYPSVLKGRLRKSLSRLSVGDFVTIEIFENSHKHEGVIKKLLPRKTKLQKPNVANIDQIFLVTSYKEPAFEPWFIDKFLFTASTLSLSVVLLFNKNDLLSTEEREDLDGFMAYHRRIGYETYSLSARESPQDLLYDLCKNKTTAFAGPSGVGKSTLMQLLFPDHHFKTRPLSTGIQRGKNTTTHTTLLALTPESFVVDTPGFSYTQVPWIPPAEVGRHFPEIFQASQHCRFRNCLHRDEPHCAVKKALEEGGIAPIRYENYLDILRTLEETPMEKRKKTPL